MKIKIHFLLIVVMLLSLSGSGQHIAVTCAGDTFVSTSSIYKRYETKLPGKEVERRLVGKWKFVGVQTAGGVKVDSVYAYQWDTITGKRCGGLEKPSRPDFTFHADMTFVKYEKGYDSLSGRWSCNDSVWGAGLLLIFDKPGYNSAKDSIWLVSHQLPLVHREIRFIHEVSDRELYIIDLRPVRKGLFGVNMEHYRRED